MALTVVFVHGMFMNPASWKDWVSFFSARGHRCVAPAWPHHEGEPAKLRSAISPKLGTLTLDDVVQAMRKEISALGATPVVIGHSMGGLVAQRLIAEKRARAAVCIDSAPPKGVFVPSWSFLKSNAPVLNPFAGKSPYLMPLEHFGYTFCNTSTPEETKRAYEAFVVPESREVARSSTGAAGAVDFSAPHAPLHFFAGEKDHIIPASFNRKNVGAYTHQGSTRAFTEFPNRTHFICGQPGWEEVATAAAEWLERLPEAAA